MRNSTNEQVMQPKSKKQSGIWRNSYGILTVSSRLSSCLNRICTELWGGVKVPTPDTIGVRDQFRLGGLRSVARTFYPLLARMCFAQILHDFFFCPKMAIWKILGGSLQPSPPPPPPRPSRLVRLCPTLFKGLKHELIHYRHGNAERFGWWQRSSDPPSLPNTNGVSFKLRRRYQSKRPALLLMTPLNPRLEWALIQTYLVRAPIFMSPCASPSVINISNRWFMFVHPVW